MLGLILAILLIVYVGLIWLFSGWLNNKIRVYYEYIPYRNKKGEIVNIHDEFYEFSARDQRPSRARLFIGSFIFTLPRFIVQAIACLTLSGLLK